MKSRERLTVGAANIRDCAVQAGMTRALIIALCSTSGGVAHASTLGSLEGPQGMVVLLAGTLAFMAAAATVLLLVALLVTVAMQAEAGTKKLISFFLIVAIVTLVGALLVFSAALFWV